MLRDGLLDAFRSQAEGAQAQAAALGAGFGRAPPVVAVVALQQGRAVVIGQRNVAVRAAEREPAVPAQQKRGEPAPVEEQNRLLAAAPAARR